jgi:DNA-binding MarR family transcriptional regulator
MAIWKIHVGGGFHGMSDSGETRASTIAGVVDNLRRVFQVVHGYSKRAERVGGLTGPQLWAVTVLSEAGPVRVSELARRMYLHPSTVVGILDRLEARGIAARTRSRADRRVVTAALTRKGKNLVAKVPEVAQGLLLTGLEGLSERDLEAVSAGLDVVVRILGARRLPPRLLFSPEVNVRSGREAGDSARS